MPQSGKFGVGQIPALALERHLVLQFHPLIRLHLRKIAFSPKKPSEKIHDVEFRGRIRQRGIAFGSATFYRARRLKSKNISFRRDTVSTDQAKSFRSFGLTSCLS